MVKRITICIGLILGLVLYCGDLQKKTVSVPQPLRQAHAHNDYDHRRPLFDALAYGFTSIEADVILKKDTLFVAHDPEDIRSERTLQTLYLDPLYELFQKNGKAIYPGWPTLYLMIDIKSDADSTYHILHPLLSAYREMVTTWEGPTKNEKAVTVILSGNRPVDLLKKSSLRFAALDGRLENLQDDSAEYFPWISESWTSHFEWRGVGEMSEDEKAKLSDIVQRAHRNGQLVRFWSTDFTPLAAHLAMWDMLLANGVDLINTDDLKGLSNYLQP